MTNPTGNIFNIQKFSTEDGPGIRTTVFMKGCPLRCLWCANPESQSYEIQVAHRESKCRGCGHCASVCPEKAVSLHTDGKNPFITIDRSVCRTCGTCIEACTTGSLRYYGECRSVDEVFEEVKKDIGYYFMSGGGITISGGEPMSQADFVAELFSRCKNLGVHTTLDTCGCFPSESMKKIEGLVDLVLFDIKLIDREAHKRYTGVYNDLILKNLLLMQKMGIQIFVRIPLIPDVSDTDENLTATAEFVSGLDKSLHIDLLPYHNYGENKYKMLDLEYCLSNFKKQSKDQLEHCAAIFVDRGLDCTIH